MSRTVSKEVVIDAPREIVWEYLQDPDLLAAWLMRNDFRPEVGRAFRFFARPHGAWDGVVHCRVTEIEAPERIAFTWNANDLGADTLVTIDLQQEGEKTRLRLLHSGFDAVLGDAEEAARRHGEGWADHLGLLALQASEDTAGARAAPPVDWTGFRLHVAIGAPPETVLRRWATSAGMESFFVEMMRIVGPDGEERPPDEPAAPGDRYVWRWHNGRRLAGRYLAPGSEGEVCFTFGESRVAVRCSPYRGGTLLVLHQHDIPDTEEARMHVHANCRAAWVYFLTVLKVLLEHGIDGRDHTRETGSSFSTYFDPGALAL